MEWKEVTGFTIQGNVLVVKDAMLMLDQGETIVSWPSITCEPGDYVLEVVESSPSYVSRARVRRKSTSPELGEQLGFVDIDNSYLAFLDYTTFLAAIDEDYEQYSDWTAMVLDDELASNLVGEAEFNGIRLLYVKSGVGDGVYKCYELTEGRESVGIECDFGEEVAKETKPASSLDLDLEVLLDFTELEFKVYLWPHADSEDIRDSLMDELRDIKEADDVERIEQILNDNEVQIAADDLLHEFSPELTNLRSISYRLYDKDEKIVSLGKIDANAMDMRLENLSFRQLCELVLRVHSTAYQANMDK